MIILRYLCCTWNYLHVIEIQYYLFFFSFFLLAANVRGLVTRGKLTKEKAEKALSMLKGVLDYTEFKDVDMVIEVSHVMEFITFLNY